MDRELKETKHIFKIELIVFVIYICFSVIMFIYHEPWLDELQAYMIAKDASFYDIFFVIPHLEGHPPFYTFLLSFLAKTDISIDFGLRLITFPFSLIATYLIIYKAPFKKVFRLLIPFTYFIFYQYTVNCRPYSVMYLAFVLAAIFYKTRNKFPLRYIFALILLCFSHAYGLIFAGCFCATWVIEIIIEYKKNSKFKYLWKDPRFWSLWCIFFTALLELLIIWPDKNSFAKALGKTKTCVPFVYSLFEMLSDSSFTDMNFYGLVQEGKIDVFSFEGILSILIGLVFLLFIIFISNIFCKKRLFIPAYLAFCTYACFGYLSEHHIGVLHLFLIFVFWCCFDDYKIIRDKNLNAGKVIRVFSVMCFFSIVINLYWSLSSCINDIRCNVWYSKDFKGFVNEYNLEDYSFLDSFYLNVVDIDDSIDISKMYSNDSELLPEMDFYPNIVNHPTLVSYLDYNCIINLNDGDDEKRYLINKIDDKMSPNEYIKKMIDENGIPDFYIGDKLVLKDTVLEQFAKDYYIVKRIDYYIPVKYYCNKYSFYIYAYKDIYYSKDDWPFLMEMNN